MASDALFKAGMGFLIYPHRDYLSGKCGTSIPQLQADYPGASSPGQLHFVLQTKA